MIGLATSTRSPAAKKSGFLSKGEKVLMFWKRVPDRR
jgi:hypothetical protein